MDLTLTGIAKSGINGEYYFVRKGKLDDTYTGLAKSSINGNYYFVRNGKLQNYTSTGIAKKVDESGYFFFKNSKLDKSFTGLAKSTINSKYYYVKSGKLADYSYKGPSISAYNDGYWHVSSGSWAETYTGKYSDSNNSYNVRNGRIEKSIITVGGRRIYVNEYGRAAGGTVEVNGEYYNADPKTGEIIGKINKVIYLTFDDGPGPYTERLINILDKYGAKATFFVNGNKPSYNYCIGKAYKSGHAIGNHTYSHDYSYCYSSDSAFWSDYNRAENIIKSYTGQGTKLLRFPGGSSNMVSRSYSYGIMSRLTSQATNRGIAYFDWNVDCNDAGGTTTSSGVYSNIISGVRGNKYSVVLCHDVKSYTVNAIEDVLIWGRNNGYAFLALTENSPTAHHGLNN